jgi:DNA repair protein RecO
MIISENVIILLTRRFGDSSLIFHSFSKEHGKSSFLAKGVLRPKSKLSGTIQTLNHIKVEYQFKENKDLFTIRSAELLDYHKNIRASLDKTTLAMTAIELTDKCIHPHYVNENIFDLLKNSLEFINNENFDYYYLAKFAMDLTRFLGFEIDFSLAPENLDTIKFYPLASSFENNSNTISNNHNERALKISKETLIILQKMQKEELQEKGKQNGKRFLSILRFYQSYLSSHLDKQIKLKALELLID